MQMISGFEHLGLKGKMLGGPFHNGSCSVNPNFFNADIVICSPAKGKTVTYEYYGNFDGKLIIYLLKGQKIDKYLRTLKRIEKTWSHQYIKKQYTNT